MITAAGVGSGIDVESIISQLMQLERQPVDALTRRRESLDVELSAFGSVKSAMNELATVSRTLGDGALFGPFQASSSDEDVYSATATGGSSAESHSVEVLSLAQNHRLASSLFESRDSAVGTGSYSFSSGDNSFSISVDATSNSLVGLRDAINDSADNTSVAASILKVDGGSRLVLNAKEGGTANTITLSGTGSSVSGFNEITAAVDAQLIVDGFAVTHSSNVVSDVIEGVTLNLKSIGVSNLETHRDVDSLRESMNQFVEKYNSLRTGFDQLSSGNLQGDRLPRNAESKLRNIFSEPIQLANGDAINPMDIGFTFDRYGVLSIDESRLEAASSGGLEKFIDIFTTTDSGFADKIETALEDYTRADGFISGREDGIENRQQSIDKQLERMDNRLISTEARYRRQFTTMDQMVTQLQSTSSFLTDRLSRNII